MYSQNCLLMSSERWQWSSGNHSCLCSMTMKKIVWRSSLPLIDDDSDGELKSVSMCHPPRHEGWSVERICLWAIVSQRRVWWSPLPLINDGDDVNSMMLASVTVVVMKISANLSDELFLACILSCMRAVEERWSILDAIDGRRALDSKYLLDRQPPDASECLLQYLEMMRMLFCADVADCSAVKSFRCREFHSSILLQSWMMENQSCPKTKTAFAILTDS